jgi:cell division septum initiation protein DivIVA
MCPSVANSHAIASHNCPIAATPCDRRPKEPLAMSYHHESDPQQTPQHSGADPTEAYQATAEWDPISEDEAWAQDAEDESWTEEPEGSWHDGPTGARWEQHAGEDWDDEAEEAAGGVAGAKQTFSVAADKITRWFSGLDRRPEYEEHFTGGDPVAAVDPESVHDEAFPQPEPGMGGGRRAAAERAVAANRRRSVAVTRDNPKASAAFARGSAHAARALRGARDRYVVAPEPIEEDDAVDEPLPELMGGEGAAPFAVAPLGYNRQAVDEHLAELERELSELRDGRGGVPVAEPPMSVQEELERIGEQTASILVVAHDKAHETTQMAQEQADRCISDAAANATAITEEAQAKLREIEAETEAVRRRRDSLIADARGVAASLVALADEADGRFPAEPSPIVASATATEAESDTPAESVASEPSPADGMTIAFRPQ